MPNFTPEGIIKIGRVPFDNSYRHTLTFANVEAQTAYFASVCTENLSGNDYTYVRMNNSIRVPFNAERLYTYDYVMYQNKNYGTKWFYAFIVAVNYVNENVTELVLQLDVMQTWYFDYTLVEGFVEREHVNDDTVGAHLNAEPMMDLQYVYSDYTTHTYNLMDCWLVLTVCQYPQYATTPAWSLVRGSYPVAGGKYENMITATKPILYDISDTNSMNSFKQDIEAFNSAGCADGIVDCYLVPKAFLPKESAYVEPLTVKLAEWFIGEPEVERPYVWTVKNSTFGRERIFNITRPTTLNGYNPRNKKLLCYPYTLLEIGDFTGRKEDYHWEYFNLSDGKVILNERSQAVSDCIGYIIPRNYQGVIGSDGVWNAYSVKPFTYDYTTKLSWVYSTYQNWIAQNYVANAIAIGASSAAMITGIGAGISAASGTLGAGVAALNWLANSDDSLNNIAGLGGLNNVARGYAYQAGKDFAQSSRYGLLGGAAGLAGTLSQIDKMSRIPNTAKGNTGGNSKFQNGYCGWYTATNCIREEFARILDDFFDCYGYAIERVKVPNRTGRRSWNYVKMQNACHRGTVPASDMEMINSIYNAGITFWHTSDVGNYSLDNSII